MRFISSLLLLGAAGIFIWRFTDYLDESEGNSFHITRAGFEIYGETAQNIEIATILIPAGLLVFCAQRLSSALSIS